MLLIPKYSKSTREAFKQQDTSNGPKDRRYKTMAELDSEICPITRGTIFYIDCIKVNDSEGNEHVIRLLSDDELPKKKSRKPKLPTVPKSDYDRILAELSQAKLEIAKLQAQLSAKPAPQIPNIESKPIQAPETKIGYVQVGQNLIPYRYQIGV